MQFEVLARCNTTRARVSRMILTHGPTMLPTFMPVATQAAIKGLTSQQTEALGVSLILNNTYHLNLRPGIDILDHVGGAHSFQGWNRNLLTDSGGFQLVSLSAFTQITEEGALFRSPFDGKMTMLTPEESMSIQHAIGADIIMQLDDVVSSLTTGPRVEEAMWRSVRWLDRCVEYHQASGKSATQNLFAIVQGGLDSELREKCLEEMIKRKDGVAGYAIGGLSGGEEKAIFWKIISQCASTLPVDRPRYSMGIGFAEGMALFLDKYYSYAVDLLVCVALGIDMADCVFPTRTARFGVALTRDGPINLKLKKYARDFSVIEEGCPCPTCTAPISRALLYHQTAQETVAAHAVTQHNITFQAQLMGGARDSIVNQTFPFYLKTFFNRYFAKQGIPRWCVDALASVGVNLLEGGGHVDELDNPNWEYAQ